MTVLELSKEDIALIKLIKRIEPALPSEDPKLIALFKHIKSDLPVLDDDIIIMWWLKRAWREGWNNDCIRKWLYNRGDLIFLQSLGWKTKEIPLHIENFRAPHQANIRGYMRLLKEPLPQPLEPESDIGRLIRCCDYLITNGGAFPYPLVLESVGQGYHVFDGEHRLAAYFHLRNEGVKVNNKQIAWIGSLAGLVSRGVLMTGPRPAPEHLIS